jgi:hypothetical protein
MRERKKDIKNDKKKQNKGRKTENIKIKRGSEINNEAVEYCSFCY